MAILAGIDEAGFGPLLGPLVVSGVAFRVPASALNGCLWDTLRATCTRHPAQSRRRLAIADSKQLYRSRGSMTPLERSALVMLAVAGHKPQTLEALLDATAPGAAQRLAGYPWYDGSDLPLPLNDDVGDIGTQANAVRRDCTQHDIVFMGAYCEPLLAGAYNRLVQSTRNKAVVLLGLAMRVMERIMRTSPGERVRLCVDRLGGRTHYREALMTSLSGYDLHIVEESETRSAYRLVRSERTCEIEFVTSGETHRFPIALASIYSKYIRELHMRLFNRFWSSQVPDLRPTAGYYTDAKRWLADVAAELDRRSVDRSLLIRSR